MRFAKLCHASLKAKYLALVLQMLSLDSDSNLWVAGGPTLTKMFINPAGITDISTMSATPAGPTLMLSKPALSSIDLSLNSAPGYAAACQDVSLGSCCTLGHWDAGIAISRDATNTIYVANSCATGLVRGNGLVKIHLTDDTRSEWYMIAVSCAVIGSILHLNTYLFATSR